MSFDPNDSRITAYVFDELNEADRTAFEAELQASEELRRLVDQTRQTLQLLATELNAEPAVALSDQQRKAVREAIDKNRATPSDTVAVAPQARRSGGSVARVAALVAVAATLLLACGLGYTFLRARRDRGRVAAISARQQQQAARAQRAVPAQQAARDQQAAARATRATVVETMATEQEAQTLTGAETNSNSSMGEVHHGKVTEDLPETDAPLAEPSLARSPLSLVDEVATVDAQTELWRRADASDAAALTFSPDGRRLAGPAAEPGEYYNADRGTGPGWAGDRYTRIVENGFKEVKNEPLSTFSIDVDTASYAKVRMYLMQQGILPRPDAVRIEELINYFTYDYQPPTGDVPFAAHVEVAECPWRAGHRLVRVGVKGKEIDRGQRPTSNLVFLLDVSGSMNRPNKLPLLKRGMKMLVDQLGENDRVAIVVYAGAAGRVLESTPGDQKQRILDALERLHAGGSTNGGQGIRLAYQTALDHFVQGGVNRVILCTDGDFNVGVTGTDELVRLAEENAKTGVFLSVLGFGMGNHNDAMLEQISNRGNGNYAFIDSDAEARKVLVEQMSGTLVTIAKDVKIQIEFNPAEVSAYRLIGYENRMLAAEDFNDDQKDAGEIGAGHTVTALYEIVPAGVATDVAPPPVDELRYQRQTKPTGAARSGELLTLKIRYKQPDADESTKLTFPVTDDGNRFGQASRDFRFAAAVASFGMLLRDSQFKGDATFAGVLEIATAAASDDPSGYRQEFLQMIARAKELSGTD